MYCYCSCARCVPMFEFLIDIPVCLLFRVISVQSALFWNSWIQPDSVQILYVGPTKSGCFLGHPFASKHLFCDC